MKILFSTFLLFIGATLFAQEDDFITDFVDVEPKFPGGESAMMDFISDNINYPLECRAKGQQGIVYVQFVVRKSGEITDVTIMRGVCEVLDKEATSVISSMPKWSPGSLRGKKVDVRYTLPVHFKLLPGDQKRAKKEMRKNKKKDRNPNVIDY